MNATNHSTLQSEAIERIMREHDTLREKVQSIHCVLAEPEPAQAESERLLREFLTTLIVHFSNEEDEEGFFAEVTAHAPRLSRQAAQLCVEHRQLLHEADELCRFASGGAASMPWWRELRTRCHEFNKRLMNHEREESNLLQAARQADTGAID